MPPFERGLVALLPRMRRFSHGLTGNAADADDLTQTAIERALKAQGQWEEGTRLDAWLYRITRNCYAMFQKSLHKSTWHSGLSRLFLLHRQ